MFLKNQRVIVTGIMICVLFAGVMFYYNNYKIPKMLKQTENGIRAEIDINSMPVQKVVVVVDKVGISKYTELTDEVVSQKLALADIPAKFVVSGAVTSLEAARGKVAKEDLRPGEQIPGDSLSDEKRWYGEYQRLKEYAVASIVADEVKAGNIVDVTVVYGDGSYDVVVPRSKIIKLVAGKGAVDGVKPDTYTIVIAVDENQYRDLELAHRLGKLETRLYIDENQKASKRTFDYSKALRRGKAKVVDISAGDTVYQGMVQSNNDIEAETKPDMKPVDNTGTNTPTGDDRVPVRLGG